VTDEQLSVLVETLNDLTVSVQLLASRLTYEAGQDAIEARTRCAEANRKLYEAFPEFGKVENPGV